MQVEIAYIYIVNVRLRKYKPIMCHKILSKAEKKTHWFNQIGYISIYYDTKIERAFTSVIKIKEIKYVAKLFSNAIKNRLKLHMFIYTHTNISRKIKWFVLFITHF